MKDLQQLKKVAKTKLVSIGKFLYQHQTQIIAVAVIAVVTLGTAYATAEGGDAKALWDKLFLEVETWVKRLGAMLMFLGGIMFAMGFKSDDAEQKSRGLSTAIAGALVIGIAVTIKEFTK